MLTLCDRFYITFIADPGQREIQNPQEVQLIGFITGLKSPAKLMASSRQGSLQDIHMTP